MCNQKSFQIQIKLHHYAFFSQGFNHYNVYKLDNFMLIIYLIVLNCLLLVEKHHEKHSVKYFCGYVEYHWLVNFG